MPDYFDKYRSAPASTAPPSGDFFDKYRAPTPPPDEEIGVGTMVAGGAGLAAVGAMGLKAAQAPGGIPGKVMAFGGQLNALRQQAMLSGLALPKSIAGGVGASVANAIERKSLSPLKALFSGETVHDIGSAWKAGRELGPAGSGRAQLPKYLDAPGRAMGAVDEAIQKSLVRSGTSSDEATAALLQTPLPERLSKAFDNPVMSFIQPFRRTPFNAFMEGGKAVGEHPAISAGYGAVGAVQGAAQSDEQYPLTAGLGVAASGKYGIANALGQMFGRYQAGGEGGGGIAGSALPVSEYGLTSSVTDPLRPFEKPAAMTMFEKLGLIRRRQQ